MNTFLVWFLQSTVFVAVGVLLARFLHDSRARLWFWQGLVLLLLLLPFVEPWTQPRPEFATSSTAPMMSGTSKLMEEAPNPFWTQIEVWHILFAGALLRFAWLIAGLWRLRRLRLEAHRIAAPIANYEHAVEWYVSGRVAGPVTFGWLRPSILLPEHICSMPPEMQFAVAWHELLHVERRDWLFVMAEETIRSVLWFHPAAWYALSQAQLAREQLVDGEVVAATRDQAGYLEALVAVAARNSGADLAPAPLFLKKRQLAIRVAAILKEAPMSKFKILTRALLASTVIFATAITLAVFVPFEGQAQMLPDSSGITVDPGAELLHRTALLYTNSQHGKGTVVADLSVNAKGEVTDAHVVSGPDDLRKLVLSNVLEWHYAPTAPPSVRATVTFAEPPAPAPPPSLPTSTSPVPQPPPLPPPGLGGRGGPTVTIGEPLTPPFTFARITYLGLSPLLEQEVRQKLGFQEGQTVNMTREQIQGLLQLLDEHLLARVARSSQGEATLIIGVTGDPRATPRQVPPVPEGTQRISQAVARTMLATQVKPVYPAIAKMARVQGSVVLDVVIGTDGRVQNAAVIEGVAMLRQAALDAVSQWVYKPYLLNGQPTSVATNVEVNFALN